MRQFVFYVHLWIALLAGMFILILALTGSILAFEPELDRVFHPRLYYVAPGPRVLSLGAIGQHVLIDFPGESIVAYMPSVSPELSWQVALTLGMAYVDPYTGKVLGLRARGQNFLAFVEGMHIRYGNNWFALLLLLVSGVYLWWPSKRMRIRGGWSTRHLWFDVHNTVGISSLLFLITLGATGAAMGPRASYPDEATSYIYKLADAQETRWSKPATVRHSNSNPITPDEALAIARIRVPDTLPYRVELPTYDDVYRIALSNQKDTVTRALNSVVVDAYSGKILNLHRSQDQSTFRRILAVNEAIHTGNIFAMPSRILMSVGGVMVLVESVTGVLMWWKRKHSKRN